MTSPLYDPHDNLSLSYSFRNFGQGSEHKLTIYILNESNEIQATHTSATTTSSYANGSWNIGNIAYKFKIKFYLPSTGKGVRLQSPTLTGDPVASCDNKVTVTKSSATNGSYILKAGSTSGATIDNNGKVDNCDANATIVLIPSANTHYHVDEVTASNSTSVSGPDASGNYTITYTKGSNISTTIGVTFAADPTYTVTWVAGSNSSFSTQINYAGTALTAPGTPSAELYCPGGKVFKGWTATPIEGEADEAPADLFTSVSGKSIPVNGTTYYAVFATENSETINVPASDKQYTATITYSQLTANASYANSDGDYSSTGTASDESATTVGWTTYNVQNASSKLHFKSNSGYIYNKSTWGTINSVSFSDNQSSNFNVYIGSSSQPSSAGSGGFFKIAAKTVSGGPYVATITITYTQGSPASSYEQTTYTDYATSCCTPLVSINGSFNRYHFRYHLKIFHHIIMSMFISLIFKC